MLFCIAVSLAYNAVMFRNAHPEPFRLAMMSAVVLPTILAGPLFVYLLLKLRDLRILNRELQIIAAHDGLTTLLNRRAFTERAEARLEAMATGDVPGALFLIDADFFKSINDRYGHATGDRALKAIALRLKECLRPGDIIGRLGGEEFGVLLPGVDRSAAMIVAERFCDSVASIRLTSLEGKLVPLSVSVGGVLFDAQDSFHALYQAADDRLYKAKASGRNRFVLANAVLRETVAERAEI
ncbi:GGDEF domain-containing protein [Aurantimonas sp. A2-1-M11]|uniref:GGDEF domain-containing protein n=1 Tax=Aurantimonas sp. A2-1-M11 TaxID=3113712 RepID=UPI002F930623